MPGIARDALFDSAGRISTAACRCASGRTTCRFSIGSPGRTARSTTWRRSTSSAPATKLRRVYDLIVFPGHHEYVTDAEFDAVARFRDPRRQPGLPVGEQLLLEGGAARQRPAQDRHVARHRTARGRARRRPVHGLRPHLRGPYLVLNAGAAPWLFRGTGLRNGRSFGTFGIEIDRKTAASPRGTKVLAEVDNRQGRVVMGQMAYYQTKRGARVFAAGAFTLAGSATRSYGARYSRTSGTT